MAWMLRLPFLVVLVVLSGIAMLVPMAHAVRIGDFIVARVFLQSGLLIVLMVSLVGIALLNRPPVENARSQLVSLLIGFVLLPVPLGLPLVFLQPGIGWGQIYFEMLSCLTTTGATIFEDAKVLSEPEHLWRALVGWLGGFLMIVSAVSIFAPMNLGGFEVYSRADKGKRAVVQANVRAADIQARLLKYARRLGPIYLAATAILALGLTLEGERPFLAVVLAMSTLSTSGITPFDQSQGITLGLGGEIIIFLFLIFAVSRVFLPSERSYPRGEDIKSDYEVRLMLVVVSVLPLLLFLRHWIGALDENMHENGAAALNALWGSIFTVLSFLTTTGFISSSWHDSEMWSGLQSSGIILLALAVMGGGIATTAGGVKLLRVYALYKHGVRELQRLSYPSSVAGAGGAARHIRREGAYVAWMFFMLFAIAAALVMLGLSLTGLDFDHSLAFATAALSTTGPLAIAAFDGGMGYGELSGIAQALLGVAMILGRLETLAIIAVMNPDFWRR